MMAKRWNPLPQPDDAFALDEECAEQESYRLRVVDLLDQALAVLQRDCTKLPIPIRVTWPALESVEFPSFSWSR